MNPDSQTILVEYYDDENKYRARALEIPKRWMELPINEYHNNVADILGKIKSIRSLKPIGGE